MSAAKTVRTVGVGIILLGIAVMSNGCATTDATGPYSGQEYTQGLPAVGAVLASAARKDAPISTNPAPTFNTLRGLGTLLDLMKH
jgi:hypothetical protein